MRHKFNYQEDRQITLCVSLPPQKRGEELNLLNPPYHFNVLIFKDFTILCIIYTFMQSKVLILCYSKKRKCAVSFASHVKYSIFELSVSLFLRMSDYMKSNNKSYFKKGYFAVPQLFLRFSANLKISKSANPLPKRRWRR